MADLVRIVARPIGDEANSVDARELHEALGVGRDFSTWMHARIEQLGFVEHVDFAIVEELRSPVSGSAMARPQKVREYILTIDAAKHLALAERTDAGKRVRAYFIEAERRLRNGGADTMAMLADPAHLRALLLSYAERTSKAEAALAAAAPKVEVFDRIIDSGDTFGFREAAQQIRAGTGASENEVRGLMRARGWIQRLGQQLAPAHEGVARGYVTTRERSWTDETGATRVRPELRVTPKGIARAIELLLATGAA